MQFWLVVFGVFIVIFVLVAAIRSRQVRRRSSADMRDYMRRNFRIGQQHWE
jgi:hypothetical protein